MKVGVSLLGVRPQHLAAVAQACESLGYESAWLWDHLILPATQEALPHGNAQLPSDLPLFDIGALLAHLAAATTTLRLGTWIYVLPLRHPFVTARLFQTADLLSNGRIEIGVGTGYVMGEFEACGVEFASRGRRMDETIQACQRLWADPEPQFHGEAIDFGPVMFEPKPHQRPWPPLHVGGESGPALRRAARHADGWIAGEHTPETLAPVLTKLRAAERAAGRTTPLQVTVGAGDVAGSAGLPCVDRAMLDGFRAQGVDRIIVRPWRRSRDAVSGLGRFARECLA